MQPIIYEGHIDVRFSDLDPYGHVNAKHYLDYVSSTRFRYMEDVLGVTNDDVMERGYQFFIRRSEFEYLRSVNGCQRLYVRSFVTQQRGPLMSVSFEICDRSQTTVFCKGIFDFVLVDSHQRLVRRVPEWITQLFLRPEPDTDQLDVQP